MAKSKNPFHIFPYNLQLISPLKTSKGEIKVRHGLCLLLGHNGKIGIGTTPNLAPQLISGHAKKLALLIEKLYVYSDPKNFLAEILEIKGIDPLLTAVEIAARDLIAQKDNISFASSFRSVKIYRSHAKRLPVRALINTGASDLTAEIKKIKAANYKSLKLKVGDVTEPDLGLARDLKNIETIKDVMSDAPLALDANGAYAMDSVGSILKDFAKFGIEYIEEPVEGIDSLIALSKDSPVPIAVDESCKNFKDFEVLGGAEEIKTIVVKPTNFAHLQILYNKLENLVGTGKQIVISSGIDSAVGLLAAMHLAASLDGAENTFTGLDTSKLILKELIGFSFVVNGYLDMPEKPGLGANLPAPYRKFLQR